MVKNTPGLRVVGSMNQCERDGWWLQSGDVQEKLLLLVEALQASTHIFWVQKENDSSGSVKSASTPKAFEASQGGVLSLRTAFKADLAPSHAAASDFLLSTRSCRGKIAAAALDNLQHFVCRKKRVN
ncbi:uncharacterized protein V6R79_005442 [Siganus canaliculatus]